VVQIVTDSAARCKAAADKLLIEFPTITWTPCTAHQTDVLLTSIDKLPCVKPLIDSAKSRLTFCAPITSLMHYTGSMLCKLVVANLARAWSSSRQERYGLRQAT
jgi:hypothetical protein